MMSYDVEKIRKDFPILSTRVGEYPLTYLDSANTSQKPQVVIDALGAVSYTHLRAHET